MKINKILMAAILGMSVSSAQAALLEFSGTYASDEDLDLYHFDLLGDGSVKLYSDTLTDGLNSHLTLFKLNKDTDSYDWSSSFLMLDASYVQNASGANTTGVNEFGVALKNGWVSGNPDKLGLSDAGGTLNLTQGSYRLVHTGFFDWSVAQYEGRNGTYAEGFNDYWSDIGFEEPSSRWSTFPFRTSNDPHAYKVFVDGNVALTPPPQTPVPVPGAIWLFGTALVGFLGAARKKA